MGPLLVLVSLSFRENVVVTCKIVSFLCSLDNLLQKDAIVFFFGNEISKWRSFEKGLFLTYFSHFLVTREKLQKFFQHISVPYFWFLVVRVCLWLPDERCGCPTTAPWVPNRVNKSRVIRTHHYYYYISLTYIHVFCSPYWLFVPYQFWKKYEFIRYGFSLVWFLVLILIRAILEQSINNKMVSKI